MKLHPINNLYYSTLTEFQNNSKGLPVRFNVSIVLWFHRCSGSIVVDFYDDLTTIKNYLDYLVTNKASWEEIIYEYYKNILYIDKIFEHYIIRSKDYILLMKDFLKDARNLEKEWWIFDVSPNDILDLEDFKLTLKENYDLWLDCTKKIRLVCEKYTLFGPYDDKIMNMTYILSELVMTEEWNKELDKYFAY